jgi:hypothetical protein
MVELTLCEESLSFPASRWKLLYHTCFTIRCHSTLTVKGLLLPSATALSPGCGCFFLPMRTRSFPAVCEYSRITRVGLSRMRIFTHSLLDSHLQLHMCVLSPSIASALVVLLQTVLVAIRPLAAVPKGHVCPHQKKKEK